MRASLNTFGMDDAVESLQQLKGNAPTHALVQVLNNMATDAIAPLQAEAASVFDRPTPFTLNAFRIDYAKPSSLEAAVSVKDEKSGSSKGQAPEAWFEPQVYGGERQLKASEKWLRQAGILPAGLYAVPGPGARLDAYGNMSRGHIQQLLSGLKAFDLSGSDHNATDSKRSQAKGHARAFFVLRRGKRALGIAERRGKTMQLVLIFVREPNYAPRFDFHKVVRQIAENDALFESYVDEALATALRRGW
ncbi:hypothetical protein [Pseudomonas sp. MYb185]|uniref:hypothetical protein n=1 Tax=Pseudomonas sp. MYb185 TaxID=1848729 RepID=UPI000CFB0E92|nr:hypothetical protein [Pseudomonas sp. MYb185]PRB80516.1 hypothetical protein CQ007_12405 [Pseudomonas sp. MYb185]